MRAAVLRERLKEKFAERQAAKADFASICARPATDPRSSFGDCAPSFDEIEARLGEPEPSTRPQMMKTN